MDFISELKWRGLIHNITSGAEEKLAEGMAVGYAGFDPTASSLQIGNLGAIMLLVHFQRAGHKPIVLIGGATGMIGDPSGKQEERSLLSIEAIQHNIKRFEEQLRHFLEFEKGENAAVIVNNYDWLGEKKILEFLRDIGKHITIGYMMAKDSVQQRLESGISFAEFSYQLLQAYDFYWLNKNKNCLFQIGGSDQWGNITAGIELIRRKTGNDVYALTCPLITKSDGTKFGKSVAGESLWLDPKMTSPYKFYQFWMNCSDDEAARYLRIFTLLSQDKIEKLEKEHAGSPHLRPLQKTLARELTTRVHSESDCRAAVQASEILFGKGTTDALKKLSEKDLLEIFYGVPIMEISRFQLKSGIDIITLLAEKTNVFDSKSEARRIIKNNGLNINERRVSTDNEMVYEDDLLNGRYILVRKGKKKSFILKAV